MRDHRPRNAGRADSSAGGIRLRRAAASLLMLLMLLMLDAAAQQPSDVPRADGNRVPLITYPAQRADCRGAAIISPGAGGSETGYRYLGETMASLGYLAVVVGHRESGAAALRERMQARRPRDALADLVTDPQAYRARSMDVVAARQWAAANCSGRESVLVGHSMGAATTMIEAGARNRLGVGGSGGEAFGIHIALSPQGSGPIFPPGAWATIEPPVLMITGTNDRDLAGASWQTRTEAFRDMPAGCKTLAVISGATHLGFAGIGASKRTEQLTSAIIAGFIDGVARGDCRPKIDDADLQLQTK